MTMNENPTPQPRQLSPESMRIYAQQARTMHQVEEVLLKESTFDYEEWERTPVRKGEGHFIGIDPRT